MQSDAFHQRARFILHRRRAGKVAQLPAPVREQINLMLRDGVPYAKIIANLGDAGKGLNKDNLSRWRKADHQDWLNEQLRLQATSARPQSPNVKNLAFLLHELDADTLRETCSKKPDNLVRVFNLAARLVESTTAGGPGDRSSRCDERSGLQSSADLCSPNLPIPNERDPPLFQNPTGGETLP